MGICPFVDAVDGGGAPAAKACNISSEEKKFHALEDNPDDYVGNVKRAEL